MGPFRLCTVTMQMQNSSAGDVMNRSGKNSFTPLDTTSATVVTGVTSMYLQVWSTEYSLTTDSTIIFDPAPLLAAGALCCCERTLCMFSMEDARMGALLPAPSPPSPSWESFRTTVLLLAFIGPGASRGEAPDPFPFRLLALLVLEREGTTYMTGK